MSLDDLVLSLQHVLDRIVRRLRLGRAPRRGRRRLLIIQIDGLSRAVLEQALAEGRMPFVRQLLQRRGFRLHPMAVGMPTSTPAFQLSAMYGVRPDIPGFHYHDKRRRADVYFPRAGDAAFVEQAQAAGRLGILAGGSAYGCVFTGGAANSLFSFATLKSPTGQGLVRGLSAIVVMTWVALKSTFRTLAELARITLGIVADPLRATRGWKLLAMKVGVSVWVRELFTLSAARDLYGGAPAVYVNYLDYDIFAHAYGPRHVRALRSLRLVDRSIQQLWRVCRRVPEHRYDLYVLADHGQAHCTPFDQLTGGRRIEQLLFDDFFDPAGATEVSPRRPLGRHLAGGIKAYRAGREPGVIQRFVNYLERDFPWVLGELKEARERGGVRVIAAGPNAFVYFLDDDAPVPIEEIDKRLPGLVDDISRSLGIGFVLARSAEGPVVVWRGKRYRTGDGATGPFAGRDDLGLVQDGIADLMAMPSAGDLVIYGQEAPQGNVSYIREIGAHAGPSADELHTFVIAHADARLPAPITHPIQLYPHFVRYQDDGADAA